MSRLECLLASFVDFNNVGRGVSTRKSKLMYLTGNQSSRSVVAIREQSGHCSLSAGQLTFRLLRLLRQLELACGVRGKP
jgi:hypothetical protein